MKSILSFLYFFIVLAALHVRKFVRECGEIAFQFVMQRCGIVLYLDAPGPGGRGYTERANVITGAPININAATPFSKELPVGEGWYKMTVRVNIVFVVGTGTTPITEGELLFIKNVFLRTDRGEIICNLPGRALYKIATYITGQAPNKNAIAAASATYRVTLPIFFADFGMQRPEDTILDTSRYNAVTLQVTLGGVADLLTTVGTSSVTATMDVEIERSLGMLPKKAKPFFTISYDFRPPVDANSLTNIELEKSADMAIKRLFVHSGTSGSSGVPFSGVNADTIQNIVTLKDQNRFIEKERIHAMIQDMNKMDAKLEAILSGMEVMDFVRDGSILAALATGQKSVLQYGWTNQGGVGANSFVTTAPEMIRTLK